MCALPLLGVGVWRSLQEFLIQGYVLCGLSFFALLWLDFFARFDAAAHISLAVSVLILYALGAMSKSLPRAVAFALASVDLTVLLWHLVPAVLSGRMLTAIWSLEAGCLLVPGFRF